MKEITGSMKAGLFKARPLFFNQSEVRSFDQWEACIQIKSNHVPLSSVADIVRLQIVFSPKYLSTMIAEQKRFFWQPSLL